MTKPKKIILASTEIVDAHEAEITKIMDVLNIKEYLITDKSKLIDFMPLATWAMSDLEAIYINESNDRFIDEISKQLGVFVYGSDTIIAIAKRMKEKLDK